MCSQGQSLGPVPPLPPTNVSTIQPGITLLEPLSRRGTGPGLIVLTPAGSDVVEIKDGVPSILVKWAEEGYAVVALSDQAVKSGENALKTALKSLSTCSKCDQSDKIGLIAYDPASWNSIAGAISSFPRIVAAVVYGEASQTESLVQLSIPTVQHLAGKASGKLPRSDSLTANDYPKASSFQFATPFSSSFDYAAEGVSHTRNLTHLKRAMQGPHFDLEAIWEEHTYYEFENRSVEHTMATMVQEPYVNHIPTMTGGIGREKLTDFYAQHFIFKNPADSELELISRTVGIDRVVDEFIYKFTHDSKVDWLIPGIPITGRRIEVPMTAFVNIRGDRLYHEHIAWDQGSVLSQLGLLPDHLPYPYNVSGKPGVLSAGGRFEYRLPVAGIETADKMRDKNSVASNEMFGFGVREAGGKD